MISSPSDKPSNIHHCKIHEKHIQLLISCHQLIAYDHIKSFEYTKVYTHPLMYCGISVPDLSWQRNWQSSICYKFWKICNVKQWQQFCPYRTCKKNSRVIEGYRDPLLKVPRFPRELAIDFFIIGEVFLGTLIYKLRQCLTIIQCFWHNENITKIIVR